MQQTHPWSTCGLVLQVSPRVMLKYTHQFASNSNWTAYPVPGSTSELQRNAELQPERSVCAGWKWQVLGIQWSKNLPETQTDFDLNNYLTINNITK